MILVDTSVWIDHFRRTELELVARLTASEVLIHPMVIGELAVGNLANRANVLADLQSLPFAVAARPEEVLTFIDRNKLAGMGLAYVDVCLLASVKLTPDTSLWTRDRRLEAAAKQVELSVKA